MRASQRVALFVVLLMSAVSAQQAPDQSLARLKPAAGLEVKLWASEPMVTNPTSMAIDERGRIWVSEAVNYRRALPASAAAGNRSGACIEGRVRVAIAAITARGGRSRHGRRRLL
jgi:hypothetical protein